MRTVGLAALVLTLASLGCGRLGFGDRGNEDRAEPEPGDGDVVTLTVESPAGPLQGIPIIFHNEKGEVLSEGLTDFNGQAWDWVPEGGMVTIPDPGGNSYAARYFSARTITGLSPGDRIQVGSVVDPWSGSQTLDVTLAAEFTGADHYIVSSGCSSDSIGAAATGTAALYTGPDCFRGNNEMNLVAMARDSSDNVLATATLTGLASDASSAVIPDSWNVPAVSTVTVNVSNAPASTDDFTAKVWSLFNNVSFSSDDASADAIGSSGSVAVTLLEEMVDARSLRVSLDFDDPNDPDAEDSIVYHRAQISRTGQTIDLDYADFDLPIIRTVTLDTTAARPTVYIDAEASLEDADHGMTTLEWVTVDDHGYEWIIFHPAGVDTVVLPELPKAYANYLAIEQEDVTTVQSMAIDYDFVDTYASMLSTYGFELFFWENYFAPVTDWSYRATAGPGGFKNL